MTKKLFAVMLLALTLTACEPSGSENNSNSNGNAKPATPAASSPAAPSPEPSASVKPPVKAGDKVKITINGVATAATVISVDEKTGKVTVRVQGAKEDQTVAIADITRE